MPRLFPGGTAGTTYLNVGDVSAIDITGTRLTVSAWIKATSLTNNANIVAKRQNAQSSIQYYISCSTTGGVAFKIGDGVDEDSSTTADVVEVGTWYHLCGVKEGTGTNSLRIYADGVLRAAGTSARTIANLSSPLRFGDDDGGTFWHAFHGSIAEVSIWADSLSNWEIYLLSKGILPLSIRPRTLRGYWPLSDYGASGQARDLSQFNSTATMTGAIPLTTDNDLLQETPRHTVYIPYEIDVEEGEEHEDAAEVYLKLTPSGTDEYEVGCLILGDGEAQLRWSAGDQQLRWLGYDANLRWDAVLRLGTGQC